MANKPKSAVFTAKQWEEHLANKRKQQLIKDKLKQQTRKGTTYVAQPDAVNLTLRVAHNLPENVNVDSKVATLIIKDKDSKSLSNPANAYLNYKENLEHYDEQLEQWSLKLKALRRFVENGLIADLILSNPRFVEESAAPMDNTIIVTPYGSTEIQTPQQLLAGLSFKNPLTPAELALTIAPVALPLAYMVGAGGVVPLATSIWTNPISWGASMGLGYLGSEGVNSGVRLLSNNKYNSWGDMLGTTDTEKFILEFTNPGGLWGGIKGWNLGRGGDKVINTFRLGREMYGTPININTTEPILNAGWGPKLTLLVIHKSSNPDELVTFNPQRWDVVNEGANPFGIWYLGKQGVPRTVQNGASAEKAAKAEKARQLFEDRPFTHSGQLTLHKPIVTVGEVPDRSALSYAAELMGADGIIYNGVYDNGFNNNLVILSFRLPLLSTIFSTLPAWEIEHLPGYLLKILMEGSPLEKSINKNGLINVNVLKSLLNSTSKVNKEIIEKVLNTKFAGQKNIDYNDLRKAVLEELVTFDTNEVIKFKGYGIDLLGYQMSGSKFSGGSPDVDLYSVVFSSEKIPNGNATHYSPNTLAHSRTFTNPNEPDVLYVMESQSDWAQQSGFGKTQVRGAKYKADLVKHIQDNIKNYPELFVKSSDVYIELADALRTLADKIGDVFVPTAHEKYLIDNYVRRLVLENMRLAATKGQTKMRYPTPETAAKILYYPKEHTVTTYPIADGKMLNDVVNLLENMSLRNKPKKTIFNQKYYSLGAFGKSDLHLVNGQLVRKEGELGIPVYQLQDPLYTEMILKLPDLQFDPNYSLYPNYSKLKLKWDVWTNWLRSLKVKATTETVLDYSPKHQTILKKYTEFPDIYRSIIKDGDVRTVTDAKGNTWYEVDVPENFLDMELLYKKGGVLKLRFE